MVAAVTSVPTAPVTCEITPSKGAVMVAASRFFWAVCTLAVPWSTVACSGRMTSGVGASSCEFCACAEVTPLWAEASPACAEATAALSASMSDCSGFCTCCSLAWAARRPACAVCTACCSEPPLTVCCAEVSVFCLEVRVARLPLYELTAPV